jgi:hypothetical protein
MNLRMLLLSLALSTAGYAQTTYTALNGPIVTNVNDVVRTAGGVLLTATNNGIYRSADDGITWARITIPVSGGGTAVAFSDLEVAASSGLIYAASGTFFSGSASLFSSADNGLTWTQVSATGLGAAGISRIRVAPNGNIWVLQPVPAFHTPTLYRANAATPTVFNTITTFASGVNDLDIGFNNQIIVSTQGHATQISTNNGLSFTGPGSGLATSANVWSATATSFSGGPPGTAAIFAAIDGDIFRSIDHGVSWVSVRGNITEWLSAPLLEVDPDGNLTLFTSNFIFSSTAASSQGPAASVTWTPITHPNPPARPRAAVLSSTTSWYAGFDQYGIGFSGNGGASWTRRSAGIKSAIGNQFSSPRIFRTTTGRLLSSWELPGMHVSIDDGANWDLLNSGDFNRRITGFHQSSTGLFAFGSGVLRSADNGQTWSLRNASEGLNWLTSIGSMLYGVVTSCCSPVQIRVSTDDGATWTGLDLTGLPATYQISRLYSNGQNTLYILITSSANNGVYTVNPATGVATRLTNLAFIPSELFVIQNTSTLLASLGNNLAISVNGGGSWLTRTAPSVVSRVWAADDQNIAFQPSGATASLSHSVNGGGSWQTLPLADPNSSVNDLIFTPQGFAYAVGSNMTAHKSSAVVVAPRAPSNLMEIGRNTDFANIIFNDNSTIETGYELETSVGNNLSYQLLSTLGAVSNAQNRFTTTVAATADVPTFIRVRAVNAAGVSAYSNEISVTALPACTPVAANLVPNNRSWTLTAVPDAGSVPSNTGPFVNPNAAIRVTNRPGSSVLELRDVVANMGIPGFGVNAFAVESCGQTVLSSGTFIPNGNSTWDPATNTLVVRWQNMVTLSAFSGTSTYVLNASDPVPPVPTLSAFIYSSTEVFVSWGVANFALSYEIERSTVSGSGFTPVATVNFPATSMIDRSLTSGQTYFYRIRAVNASGASAFSAEAPVTLGPTLFRPIESAISQNFENQQGVSWADLDNDGDEDLLSPSFVNNLGERVPPVFYENRGNNVFDRRDLAVLQNENQTISRGIGAFDFDNDGDLDFIVVRSGNAGPETNMLLLKNNGSWNFEKISVAESMPAAVISFRGFAVTDYDRDGFADVLLGDQIDAGLNFPVIVLRNNRGNGFVRANAGALSTDLNGAITLAPADYDNDGDQDVFVVNRGTNQPNRLYRNEGNGTFTRITGQVFDTDVFTFSRTASWGDIDNDGDLDLYVGVQSTAFTDRLYQNNGDGTFTSLTASTVAEGSTGTFGSAWGDIDNDGDLDLIAVNGGASSIFINNGTGVFSKSSTQELLVNPNLFQIGGSFADFDNDGFLDFYPPKGGTAVIDLPNLLFKNTLTASATRNWLGIRLQGVQSNRAALGARVRVITPAPNARTQSRELAVATGYGSHNSLVQHFGLGAATTATVEVRWPSGFTQTLAVTTVNRIVTILEDNVGPALTVSPAHGATNVNTNTSLVIALNEPATAVTGRFLRVFRTADLATPVFEINVSAAAFDAAANRYTFTLPQKLQLSTGYSVSVEAGMFTDGFGNASLELAATAWQFTTSAGPQVVSLVPAHNAANVAVNAALQIQFNIPVTAVAGRKLIVRDEASPATPLLDAELTSGTIAGNQVTFAAPAANWPFLRALVVTVEPGGFMDANQNDFPGIASGAWRFTTREVPDTDPPAVVFTPPATLTKGAIGASTTTFNVTATDNRGVTTARMTFRKVTATATSTRNGNPQAGNVWQFPVSESDFDDVGLEYFFEFADSAGNATRNPQTGFHITRLRFPAALASVSIAAGNTVSAYRIFSIPFVGLTSNQINVLFPSLPAPDPRVYRLLRHRNTSATEQRWDEYPGGFSSIARGEGYFILTRDGYIFQVENAEAPNNTAANPFTFSLRPGWNLIGNPYTVAMNWNTSRQGVAGVGELKVFEGGSYVNSPTGDLDIYQGGFVFANAAATVPARFRTTGGRTAPPVLPDADLGAPEWLVPLRLTQGEFEFTLAGFGMSPSASEGFDDWDDLNPPAPWSAPEIRFARPNHFMKYFARDMAPHQGSYEWRLHVSLPGNEAGILSWNPDAIRPSGNDLVLIDDNAAVLVNMLEHGRYVVHSDRPLRIYFGADAERHLRPGRSNLGMVSPNPATERVTVPFGLSDAPARHSVTIDVFDAVGRKVATLAQGEYQPGYHQAEWNIPEGMSAGVYTIRMVAGGTQREVFSKKILIQRF